MLDPCSRLCVSALSGGGGKTLLSLGLARAMRDRGIPVQPFKKGPDYIDAAWLSLAAGRQTTNLDPFLLPPERLRALFVHVMHKTSPALALVEGNRGLFDGLDARGSCSTASLARTLLCPILLCVNCTKMTRTVAALIQGILGFEPGLLFAGVVLNEVASSRHEANLRRTLEMHTDLPVLGALPRLHANPLPERHMGIASTGTGLAPQASSILHTLGDLVTKHTDLDKILVSARMAPHLDSAPAFWPALDTKANSDFHRIRIGYVHDAALWFYYGENLEALERAGAVLVRLTLTGCSPTSPSKDTQWEGLHGLYIGGGFPEDYAVVLSSAPELARIREWARNGMPIYAECGGFMLLARAIEREGKHWPMAGIFPAVVQWHDKPQGLGYVQGKIVRNNPYFPRGMEIRGHEFHYSSCHWLGGDATCALLLDKGRGMGPLCTAPHSQRAPLDGLLFQNVWASYTHIFAPATACWATNFVAAARGYASSSQESSSSSR